MSKGIQSYGFLLLASFISLAILLPTLFSLFNDFNNVTDLNQFKKDFENLQQKLKLLKRNGPNSFETISLTIPKNYELSLKKNVLEIKQNNKVFTIDLETTFVYERNYVEGKHERIVLCNTDCWNNDSKTINDSSRIIFKSR